MSTLLVTGAARGIGHEVVIRALARGDEVFAVVRKAADFERFGARPNLNVILMDVADNQSVEKGFAELDTLLAGRKLHGVVHSAAISKPNTVETATIEEFAETLNTNTLGALRILKASIPRLRGHGGRVVLLTSLWGKASGPMLGSYCASKHAIESLADTARRETAGMNLHIVLVEPGVVRTAMLSSQTEEIERLIARMTPAQLSHYENLFRRYSKLTQSAAKTAITAAQCSAVIERALHARRPKTRYRAGKDSSLVCFLAWLLPDRWMDAMFALNLNNKPLRTQ